MGAYSSWAMLALTHHVIVLKAAEIAKVSNFTNYAILGDDIVINHDLVAMEYLNIMKTLGVKINPGKSVVSLQLIEFAKRWVTPSVEYSPIGAGNILHSNRHPVLIGSLLQEFYLKAIAINSDTLRNLLDTYPFKSGIERIVLWFIYGSSAIDFKHRTAAFAVARNIFGSALKFQPVRADILYSALWFEVERSARQAALRARRNERDFYKSFLHTTAVKGLTIGFFETLCLFLSPGFWLYLEHIIRASEESYYRFNELFDTKKVGRDRHIWNPHFLLNYTDFQEVSISWDRKKLKAFARFTRGVAERCEALRNERSY